MRKLAVVSLGLLLAACDPQPSPPVGERVDTQPRPSTTGELCMPCVGPHLNLSTGRLDFGITMGPGISMF